MDDLSSQLRELLSLRGDSSDKKCYLCSSRGHVASECDSVSSKDAPKVVVQPTSHTAEASSSSLSAEAMSSSSSLISENTLAEPTDGNNTPLTEESIANYIAAQRIDIPHSQRVISTPWGEPSMLIEYSVPDVVSSYVYLRPNGTNIMPHNENDPSYGYVSVGSHTTLEEALSDEPTVTTENPQFNTADMTIDHPENESI
jgi:hypothetical protein